jgi:hypothetical protein
MPEDKELTDRMKSFEFWYPSGSSTRKAVVSASLPLSEYPAGSCFTVNGKACDDTLCPHHNQTDGCDYNIPSGFSSDRCYNLITKKSGNCKRYEGTGAIQCKAFADYVPVGTSVRGTLSNGVPHSYIVQAKTADGITIYDASGGANHCQVNSSVKNWAQLANWMPTITSTWHG